VTHESSPAANRVASLLLEASLLAALGAHPRFGCALLALGAALLALVLGRRNGLALSYVTAALSSGLLLPRTRVAVRRLVLGKIRAYAWTALPNRTATIRPLGRGREVLMDRADLDYLVMKKA
jgi:hypothetical protein